MVNQKDIIVIDLAPTVGNEKGQTRPCVVISNSEFTHRTGFAWVCPITSRDKKYPTDVPLRTVHQNVYGVIDCGQVRALDLNARDHDIVDQLTDRTYHSMIEVIDFIIHS